MPYRESMVQVFDLLEEANISFVTLERVYGVGESNSVGLPQEQYQFWLGEMFHDNIKAAKKLSDTLLLATRKKLSRKRKLKVVAFVGDHFIGNFKRSKGLQQVVDLHENTELIRVVRANWKRDEAALKYSLLKKQYGRIDMVFSASDAMGLGVADAIDNESHDKIFRPIIGGFDWIPEALKAVKSGLVTASVGGHFMQGAWAIVKLYDHHHKLNVFKKGDNKDYIEMLVVDKSNIDTYLPLADEIDFNRINFTQFSLAHKDNPAPEKGHQFSLKAFMDIYNNNQPSKI
jgi:ABC-type sugar transport system substrate-binding protein